MRLKRVIIPLFLIASVAPALAGPWMRVEGETFLSYSIETDLENGISDGSGFYGSLYAEHGLTKRLTVGLDAGGHEDDISKAIAFLRWPVGAADRKLRVSAEFGLGMTREDFALRPGISVGRGLELGDIPGWVSVDSRAVIIGSFDGVLETDITFGLSPSPEAKIILQLQTGIPTQSDPYAKLAPSYVRRIAPGRHIEVGLVAGVAEADDFKLKLGLWHQF
ncbi:hypothetical protein FIU86_11705 [Roseovarius sp. THAF9]|uniref:hypothetical protein n=1 Tax=Roseovarius sp. THAF9 TaxID=2587847 RepID=UPI00126871C6|nr:hypothetical protein [Roseovarius sp. THAF9]QFT93508.1 hypothetical protein FIU86_11705 [Roseovarius sp. THAF9]